MAYQLPEFPLEALPDRLKYFVENAAETLNCPVDFIGLFSLVVMSSAIGTARAVQLKEGWIEPSVIYAALVAPPASKKSPAFNVAITPVRQKQLELKAEYDPQLAEYKVEMARWEKDKKNNEKPQKPVLSRNFVNDFTFEALAKILNFNPKGLLLGIDELMAWVYSMDQYRKGKGADREKWLSLWTCSEIFVDRASKEEPIMLSRPFVSVVGGIQPDRLKLLSGDHHDGFIDRILFSFPEPIPDKWVEHQLSHTILQEYRQLYDELYSLQPEIEGAQVKPKILDLSPLAKEGFILFYNKNVNDIQTEANPILKATFKKIEAYMARFSLILQLCQDPKSLRIDGKSVANAAVLAEYFKEHARKVYAHIGGAQINDKILRAVAALRSHSEPMTLRDCYTKKVANCKNAAEAKQLFRELTKQGYGKMVEIKSSSGGRPTIQFHLNGL